MAVNNSAMSNYKLSHDSEFPCGVWSCLNSELISVTWVSEQLHINSLLLKLVLP